MTDLLSALRSRRLRRSSALAAVAVVGAALSLVPGSVAAASTVDLEGHGWGHGRGMGQWGAYGYVVDHGWSHSQILDHYYGGTYAGKVDPALLMRVHLQSRAGLPLIVKLEEGKPTLSPGGQSPGRAVRIQRVGSATFEVRYGDVCQEDSWSAPTTVSAGSILVHPAVAGSDDRKQMLALCEFSSSGAFTGVRWYRGSLAAVDTGSTQWAVNHAPLDQYLRGVVPRESPASWPRETLKVQAVAARSYAAAGDGRWGSAANTCDTIWCQVYGGHAHQPAGGTLKVLEHWNTDGAIADTSGGVRRTVSTGAVARTEFSSSTGGWTAGGTFPAVRDDGDDTSKNPHHTWTKSILVSSIESKYGLGTFQSIEVTERTGPAEADYGGRVKSLVIRFSGGTKTLTGDQFRIHFGLKSNWFRVLNLPPGDVKAEPAGGYVLRSDGALAPFGAAPAASGDTSTTAGLARAVSTGGSSGRAGYVLDGYGALRPFNGAPAASGGPSWPGWDIARDVAVRRDGRSGYVLDGFGGVHPFGGAPAAPTSSWVDGEDSARRLALAADGRSGYLVRSDGSVHPFGSRPGVLSSTPLPSGRTAVDIIVAPDGRSGHVVDDTGALHPFSAGAMPPARSGARTAVKGATARPDGTSGYTVSSDGAVAPFGAAAAASSPSAATSVDLALAIEPAGYVLDGYGGLHPFGGAPPARPTGYWSGWDIALRVVVRSDGAGYVMDAFAGLHPFGTAAAPAPPTPKGGPYWGGWKIARDLALLPGNDGAGYVLDGFGGLHPFGGAPPARLTGYWSGWDIARRVVLNRAGTGGYVLDAFGGLHRFAVGGHSLPPTLTGTPYWGSDVARDVVLTGATKGYIVDRYGGAHGFGGAPSGGSWYWTGVAEAVAGASSDSFTRGWAIYADRFGGLHTAPADAPPSHPTATWGDWPIARDVGTVPRR